MMVLVIVSLMIIFFMKYVVIRRSFWIFGISSTLQQNAQKRAKMAKNEKNKTTFTFHTQKVHKVKVVLFFNFGAFLFFYNLSQFFTK